jgi:LemA protein
LRSFKRNKNNKEQKNLQFEGFFVLVRQVKRYYSMSMTIILIIAAVLVGWFVLSYNGFIKGKNQYTEAWADIEVQMKRRYDLIPNLVNTVKGYATHESTAFEKVTSARAAAMSAKSVGDHSKSEAMLGQAVTGLFGIAEAYPELKANTNFLELQRELSDTENKIQAARRFYNTNVRDLNTSVEQFPGNVIAGMFNFVKMEFFDIPDNDAAQNPVEVKF